MLEPSKATVQKWTKALVDQVRIEVKIHNLITEKLLELNKSKNDVSEKEEKVPSDVCRHCGGEIVLMADCVHGFPGAILEGSVRCECKQCGRVKEKEMEIEKTCSNCYHCCNETKTCWAKIPEPLLPYSHELTGVLMTIDRSKCESWRIKREGGIRASI